MLAFLSRFPFLFGGTFIEGAENFKELEAVVEFPFLFGGTFIEGPVYMDPGANAEDDFPSFSEGLSLRVRSRASYR